MWARELVLGIIEHRAGGLEANSGLGSAIGIIRLLVTIAIFSIAIVVVLDNLGVNVTGLVAGLGIGGIAIGLAAQGIFDDLFSALSIIFDKPFRRGDSIRWDTTSGTVENIGLKIDPGPRRDRRGGGDLQHQPARARSCTTWRGSTGAASLQQFGHRLPDAGRDSAPAFRRSSRR